MAALRNSTSAEYAEKKLPNVTLVTVESYDAGIEAMMRDEIDALVADLPACLYMSVRHADDGFRTLQAPLNVEPIGIAVPATELPLQMLLDNYMSAYEDSGFLEMLQVQWLEKSEWIAQIP
jgi:ABC-type amino acid transport substrate-binding protein